MTIASMPSASFGLTMVFFAEDGRCLSRRANFRLHPAALLVRPVTHEDLILEPTEMHAFLPTPNELPRAHRSLSGTTPRAKYSSVRAHAGRAYPSGDGSAITYS